MNNTELEMMKFVIGSARAGSDIIPPEKTSCRISTIGMTVIAVVVERQRAEIHSDIISAA